MPDLKTYDPLPALKPIAENIWMVDGPVIDMAYFGSQLPFTSRMIIVRLSSGNLWIWSPTPHTGDLGDALAKLGPVTHLVSPNKIHYAWIPEWKELYPDALTWASPGVRKRATTQKIDINFDRDLGDTPEPEWAGDIDQLIFRGSLLLPEVVFLHRGSKTLILADLIENFEKERVSPNYTRLLKWSGAMHPDGKAPIDIRLTYLFGKRRARKGLVQMLSWQPERVIMAHGKPYFEDGLKELERSFRWLISSKEMRSLHKIQKG